MRPYTKRPQARPVKRNVLTLAGGKPVTPAMVRAMPAGRYTLVYIKRGARVTFARVIK
jgi:hypothetical protein